MALGVRGQIPQGQGTGEGFVPSSKWGLTEILGMTKKFYAYHSITFPL